MKAILIVMILFLVAGCSVDETHYLEDIEIPEKYDWKVKKCTEACLSHIIYHVPETWTSGGVGINFDVNELCYDVVNDPDNIRGEVDKVYEDYPEDPLGNMDWTPHALDPIVLFSFENITELHEEKVFNGTREVPCGG